MNLRYMMLDAYHNSEHDHPCKVMRDLGIQWEEGIPQSLGDQWWFNGCTNVPEKLPPFIRERDNG